jgi:hypothetical protein
LSGSCLGDLERLPELSDLLSPPAKPEDFYFYMDSALQKKCSNKTDQSFSSYHFSEHNRDIKSLQFDFNS